MGRIVGGVDARSQCRLDEFRRGESVRMLAAAMQRWQKRGLTTAGDGEIHRFAGGRGVTPALVEIALHRAEVWLEKPAVWNAPKNGREPNPVGYLIRALGLMPGGEPLQPYLRDGAIVEKWAAREKAVFDAERATTAMRESLGRIDAAAKARGHTQGA